MLHQVQNQYMNVKVEPEMMGGEQQSAGLIEPLEHSGRRGSPPPSENNAFVTALEPVIPRGERDKSNSSDFYANEGYQQSRTGKKNSPRNRVASSLDQQTPAIILKGRKST